MEYQGRVLRHEIKYAISNLDYTYLRSRLAVLMGVDQNAGPRGDYQIRSVYFDDYEDSSFYEKMSGEFGRKKYRIRIYNNSDALIRLELKEKFDRYITKSSRVISRDLYQCIMGNKMNLALVKDDEFLLKFYLATKMVCLEPKVITDYTREPYIYPWGNVRITFDKNLRAATNTTDIFDRNAIYGAPLLPGSLIMEVKYDDYLPAFIHKGLRLVRHQHMALSKYTICREFKNSLNWKEKLLWV